MHLHIAVIKNFDRHVTQTLCQNYSRQFQDFRALESLGISSCMCGVSEFNVGQIQRRETILASDSSSEFPRSNASLMVSWLVKNRLTLVQLKTLNSFMCFSQVQNCYPEAFYKCSNNLFAWSKILENGLYSGGVRRKRSMAALMDFAIRAIFLPRRRVKKLQTNIQFFL